MRPLILLALLATGCVDIGPFIPGQAPDAVESDTVDVGPEVVSDVVADSDTDGSATDAPVLPDTGGVLDIGPGEPAVAPVLDKVSDQRTQPGATYTFQPSALAGTELFWRKLYGPDDLEVNPVTGAVSWLVPSDRPTESFYVGVEASNGAGTAQAIWIVTVGDQEVYYVGAEGDPWQTPLDAFLDLRDNGDGVFCEGCTIVIRDGVRDVKGPDSETPVHALGGGIAYKEFFPPSGTPEAWTTVMAETPGRVVLDGVGTSHAMYLCGGPDGPLGGINQCDPSGVAVEVTRVALKGFIVKGTGAVAPLRLANVRHIKLSHVGVAGPVCQEPFDCEVPAITVLHSSDILLEDVAVWGPSTARVYVHLSTNVVVRRALIRMDGLPAPGEDRFGGVVVHGGQGVQVQDVLFVDGDAGDRWSQRAATGGLLRLRDYVLLEQVTPPDGVRAGGVLAVNNHLPLITHESSAGSEPLVCNDCVSWDTVLREVPGAVASPPVLETSGPTMLSGGAFGRLEAPLGIDDAFILARGVVDMDRVIFWDVGVAQDKLADQGPLLGALTGAEVNCLNCNLFGYIPESPFAGLSASPDAEFMPVYQTLDPALSGWSHLPRLEADSTLATSAGNTGVGPDLRYRRGRSGFMYGEEGSDALTTLPRWPTSFEATFRHKDSDLCSGAEDDGLQYARGFCAPGERLDSYVWSYLGRPEPPLAVGAVASDGEIMVRWMPPAAVRSSELVASWVSVDGAVVARVAPGRFGAVVPAGSGTGIVTVAFEWPGGVMSHSEPVASQ